MEAWAGGVGMTFRHILGDIGNEVPLYLRGASNRTSVVECEGLESQAVTGTERETWPGSAVLPSLTRTLRSYPVRTYVLICSSLQLPQQTGSWTQAPTFQGTPANLGEGPILYVSPSQGNEMFSGIPLQPEHISKPHERGIF